MDAVTALLALAVIIITGFIGQLIFRRTSVPDVVLLIALGMLLSPQVFGLIDESMMENLRGFQEYFMALALVFILFDGGLGLRFKAVMENMGITVFQTLSAFLISLLAVGAACMFIFQMPFSEAFLLGGIVGGTSSAVVLAIVPKMRMSEQTRTLLSLESILTDVVVIVFVVALVQIMLKQTNGAADIAWSVFAAFAISGAVGLLAGILWLELLKMFEGMPFSYMLTIAILFLVYAVCESTMLGGNGAIAALFFGLALGNVKRFEKVFKRIKLGFKLDGQIRHFNSEVTFLLRCFFFVYLGLIFDITMAGGWFFLASGIICLAIALARFASAKLTAHMAMLSSTDGLAIFAMLPRGLAAAVLATYPLQEGVQFASRADNAFFQDTGIFIQNVALVVILVTTLMTTIFTFLGEKHSTNELIRRRGLGTRDGARLDELDCEPGADRSEDDPRSQF